MTWAASRVLARWYRAERAGVSRGVGARAFALTVAMARPGGWNIDMSRFARENRPPEDYLSKSYFQIWLAGLETLIIERGLVTREEMRPARCSPRQARRQTNGPE